MLLACVLAGPPFFWIANLSCGAGQCQTRPSLKPWCPPCCWRTVPHAKLWLTFYWRGKLLSINFLISHNMVFCQDVISKFCKLGSTSSSTCVCGSGAGIKAQVCSVVELLVTTLFQAYAVFYTAREGGPRPGEGVLSYGLLFSILENVTFTTPAGKKKFKNSIISLL